MRSHYIFIKPDFTGILFSIHTIIANIPQLLDPGDCLYIGAIIDFEVSNIFIGASLTIRFGH